jgi:S1-C subfamily serine protease
MRVSNVHPGGAAERAGIHAGDVILSGNGYSTTEHGNLAWIIATKAPKGILSMVVRSVADGRVQTITLQLR